MQLHIGLKIKHAAQHIFKNHPLYINFKCNLILKDALESFKVTGRHLQVELSELLFRL